MHVFTSFSAQFRKHHVDAVSSVICAFSANVILRVCWQSDALGDCFAIQQAPPCNYVVRNVRTCIEAVLGFKQKQSNIITSILQQCVHWYISQLCISFCSLVHVITLHAISTRPFTAQQYFYFVYVWLCMENRDSEIFNRLSLIVFHLYRPQVSSSQFSSCNDSPAYLSSAQARRQSQRFIFKRLIRHSFNSESCHGRCCFDTVGHVDHLAVKASQLNFQPGLLFVQIHNTYCMRHRHWFHISQGFVL